MRVLQDIARKKLQKTLVPVVEIKDTIFEILSPPLPYCWLYFFTIPYIKPKNDTTKSLGHESGNAYFYVFLVPGLIGTIWSTSHDRRDLHLSDEKLLAITPDFVIWIRLRQVALLFDEREKQTIGEQRENCRQSQNWEKLGLRFVPIRVVLLESQLNCCYL